MGCISSKSAADPTPEPAWDGQVRAAPPWHVDPALTTAQLERLRNEFWETRVEGRAEMWQALRFAAEAEDALRDETCKAAGLRPANKQCTLLTTYDERGALYEVPMFCLSPPTNLDMEPTCSEYKDASRVVAEFVEAHQRRTARSARVAV